jgi:hypothetical protein
VTCGSGLHAGVLDDVSFRTPTQHATREVGDGIESDLPQVTVAFFERPPARQTVSNPYCSGDCKRHAIENPLLERFD